MSESGSLTPSQVMNSSQSSSEGSSIGGYVVVDKCHEHLPNSDSSEGGKSTEVLAKIESLAQGGSTSVPRDELMERVQNLTKENEELKLLEVVFTLEKVLLKWGWCQCVPSM